MTHAVCFNCGAMKFGALVLCRSCGVAPAKGKERAWSMGLSDHFLDLEELQKISADMLAGTSYPAFSEEFEAELLAAFGGQEGSVM